MLKHIRVVPLAAESLGVRSMCTYVETPNVRILLDAGVSLCPNRFGLPPHPMEFKAIEEARRRIAEAAEKSDAITLSHYHFDHHTPSFEDWLINWTAATETARQIYEGKIVFIKNPKDKINYSQRRRAWMFQKTGGKYARKLEIADDRTFIFGKATKIRFSEPVFHGPEGSLLGWVLMITVEYETEKFMFAPDVQGPMSKRTLELILKESPQLIVVGGPPSYLTGFKVDENQVRIGLENLETIAKATPCTIVEHHVLRDENWREKAKDVLNVADKAGFKVVTVAEYLGRQNLFLEAMRKRLFAEKPASAEFKKWMHKSIEMKKQIKPPIS